MLELKKNGAGKPASINNHIQSVELLGKDSYFFLQYYGTYSTMMELRANYLRIGTEINLRDEVYTKVRACRLDIENSGHLSIVAAVPIPEVIVASSSSSTGQGSFLLSLFLVCVVLACQLTLLSLAVSHAIPFIFLA